MPDPAPKTFKFCPKCGAPLTTQQIGDKPRRTCRYCGYIHFTDPKVGVGVFVEKGSKILLVRRMMNPERGKWSIPAGFLDSGEDPKETAVRETLEETGLHVKITRLLNVYFNPPGQGGASIFIMYQAKITGGTLQPGDDADDADFFALDSLPEIAFASTRDAIAQFAQTQSG